jgi:putative ABC transport system permease protein
MRWFYKLPLRLRSLFHKAQVDQELSDELRFHLEKLTQERIAKGMTPEQARYAALRELGGVEQIKEECRDMRQVSYIENFIHDARYGFRLLARSRGFTALAVIMLALGIGVNTEIFTILNAAAFRPLPVPDSGQLVGIYQTFRGNFPRNVYGAPSLFSYSEYQEYRDRSQVFSGLLAYWPSVAATLGGVQPQQILGTLTTCNYFEVLEARPQLGRGFVDADCAAPGQSAVVVLSDRLWRGKFGADRSIIGRVVTLNRNPFVVVGIAAPDFLGTEPMPSEFWAPLTMQAALVPGNDFLADKNLSWLVLLGRVKPGVPFSQVRANLGVIANHIDTLQPGRTTSLSIHRANLFGEPRERGFLLGVGTAILCAAGLVLLIVCVNIANLLLARAAGRRKEIAVRLAIGAGRWRLVRQLLTESLLLAILGGVLGSLVAFWSAATVMYFVVSHLPQGAPSIKLDIGVDVRVLAFALAATVLTGIAFGLVPALQVSSPDLNLALKSDGDDSERRQGKGRLLRGGLVGVQVAVCTVLLLTAGLVLRALYRAQTVDPGFEMNKIRFLSRIRGSILVRVSLQEYGRALLQLHERSGSHRLF